MPDKLVESALGAGIETAATMAAMPNGKKLRRGRTSVPPGACNNCHSALRGPYCHVCGQDTRSLRRPVWSLFLDALEGLFGLDGRIWHTLVPLMLRPGYVTRRYLAGIRQPYISPVRLFLSASLVLFISILLAGNDAMVQGGTGAAPARAAPAHKLQKAQEAVRQARQNTQTAPHGQVAGMALEKAEQTLAQKQSASPETKTKPGPAEPSDSLGQTLVCAARKWLLSEAPDPRCTALFQEVKQKEDNENKAISGKDTGSKAADVQFEIRPNFKNPPPFSLAARQHFVENLQKAVTNPKDYQQALNRWAPRLAFLLAPAYALLLGAVFFWRRNLYLYDHLVVALHFQTFVFLFIALLIPAGLALGPQVAGPVFLVWSNIYLYLLLRRVYHSRRLGALIRVNLLDISYLVLLAMAFLLLLFVGVLFV